MKTINYRGLRARPTYEEKIDYLQNSQEIIRYPNREAKRIRNSPFLTQLDGIGMTILEEQQANRLKEEEKDIELKKLAERSTQTYATLRTIAERQAQTIQQIAHFNVQTPHRGTMIRDIATPASSNSGAATPVPTLLFDDESPYATVRSLGSLTSEGRRRLEEELEEHARQQARRRQIAEVAREAFATPLLGSEAPSGAQTPFSSIKSIGSLSSDGRGRLEQHVAKHARGAYASPAQSSAASLAPSKHITPSQTPNLSRASSVAASLAPSVAASVAPPAYEAMVELAAIEDTSNDNNLREKREKVIKESQRNIIQPIVSEELRNVYENIRPRVRDLVDLNEERIDRTRPTTPRATQGASSSSGAQAAVPSENYRKITIHPDTMSQSTLDDWTYLKIQKAYDDRGLVPDPNFLKNGERMTTFNSKPRLLEVLYKHDMSLRKAKKTSK